MYSGYGAGVNVAALARAMRPAIELWMNGAVQIVDPNIKPEGQFNRWTNVAPEGSPAILWEGKARIQQLGVSKANLALGSSEIAGIRFQIPYDIAEEGVVLRKGLQVFVTDGGEDQTLTAFSYVIREGINSSGMWTRTIEASVDLGDADYSDTLGAPGGP